ncbi:2730_t:CDS:2 [Entrophospora sp. SA101]|nr:13435_t:CDS:2 [Entrophospora sp. SA101]CAJ0848027.1 13438_t:CDS:2 [Entrophospora sp. SA101]CAJ0848032.1 2730_t:CDS:2 [Entrophospora sp. SA101]
MPDGHLILRECGSRDIKYKFCISCEKQYFIRQFGQWTSNNVEIDRFIKYTQTKAMAQVEFFEWIEWSELDLIEYEDTGLYSTIYSAYWIDGPILLWEKTMDCYIRNGPIKVAIKRFNNSQNISEEFINRLYKLHSCVRSNYIIDCFGLTRDNTSCFCLVMKYYENGNLYQFLDKSKGVLCWRDIVEILWSISNGLDHIHRQKLFHANLHGGNILVDNENDFIYTCISDVGLNIPGGRVEGEETFSSDENNIYGVLPYIAPEVLLGRCYTYKSDIYSFGLLMWTLAAGTRPFYNVAHNEVLAQKIIDGERPKISKDAPKSYNDLMEQCWNHDPTKRPTASKLYETIGSWFTKICNDPTPTEISVEFDQAEEIKFLKLEKYTFQKRRIHKEAIYTSRLLNFPALRQ